MLANLQEKQKKVSSNVLAYEKKTKAIIELTAGNNYGIISRIISDKMGQRKKKKNKLIYSKESYAEQKHLALQEIFVVFFNRKT